MRSAMSWAVIAAAALLVGLLAYGVAQQGEDTSIDDAVAKGERVDAPTSNLPVLGQESREQSLDDYRGKVVVLNFWASWCPPCVDELPLLQKTQKQIEARGATVLGVNYKDLPEKARSFERRYNLTYPSLRDRDGEYAEDYGSRAFPETFVIDRQGRIAAKRRGPVTQEWLDQTLPKLIEEKA